MKDVFIHNTTRTAHGKRNGMFRNTDAVELSAAVIKDLGVTPDEVIWGCTQQYGVQGYNVARQASLKAGLKNTIPAFTVNRLCGSAMTATHTAYANIVAGLGDTYIVGGVEHMTHNPMTAHYKAPKQFTAMAQGSALMGLTAEMVAKLNMVDRERQDEFAYMSHLLANEYMWKDITTIVPAHGKDGALILADYDEGIRSDTTPEALAELKGAFDPKGTVTAGNSSGIADGASGLVLSSSCLGARAIIRGIGVSAGDPATMGFQPVYAIQKALEDAYLPIGAVDAWEINEAFAGQALAVTDALKLDTDKVNMWGGSIAIGHPLGSSGTRIIHTLLNVMEEEDLEYGVASLCVGMGQGLAIVIERKWDLFV